jgi:hypothetical protein
MAYGSLGPRGFVVNCCQRLGVFNARRGLFRALGGSVLNRFDVKATRFWTGFIKVRIVKVIHVAKG